MILTRTLLRAAAFAAPIAGLHAVTISNPSFETPDNPDSLGGFASGESRDFGPNGTTNTAETGDENRITGWTTVKTNQRLVRRRHAKTEMGTTKRGKKEGI